MALKSGRVGIHPSQVDPITGMLINTPTPGSMSFEDLSDAQITDPEVGQTLIYNGDGWENEFSSISPTLSALQDVQITDPEDGDYLTYDSTSEKWINSGSAPGPTYTDLTVTIYGAVEDTISFTDAAGISHSEVFASGQSSKSVTFKINPSGSTITFTSAVAKNPDDLTTDYSKSVTITSATTEIKVMHDNSLYWWGYVDSDFGSLSAANGWTGSFTEPTWNSTNVRNSSSSFSYFSGVAKKTAVALSKICAVLKGETINPDNVYGYFVALKSKTVPSSDAVTSEAITSNAIHKKELTINYTGYPSVTVQNGSHTVYALWYE